VTDIKTKIVVVYSSDLKEATVAAAAFFDFWLSSR